MASADKALVWLHGEVKTLPLSAAARLEVCQRCLRAYDQAGREQE